MSKLLNILLVTSLLNYTYEDVEKVETIEIENALPTDITDYIWVPYYDQQIDYDYYENKGEFEIELEYKLNNYEKYYTSFYLFSDDDVIIYENIDESIYDNVYDAGWLGHEGEWDIYFLGGYSVRDTNFIHFLWTNGNLYKPTEYVTIDAGEYYSSLRASNVHYNTTLKNWITENGQPINKEIINEITYRRWRYSLDELTANAYYYDAHGDEYAFNNTYIIMSVRDDLPNYIDELTISTNNTTMFYYEYEPATNTSWSWYSANSFILNESTEVTATNYELFTILDYDINNEPAPPPTPPAPTYDDIWDFLTSIFTGLAPILDIQLFGFIPISYLIAIPIIFAILKFILGLFE